MKAIGYIATTLVLMVYGTVMNGWALSKLWGWFIVTSLHWPPLNIPAAIGVALVVQYMSARFDEKEAEEDYGMRLLKGALLSTFGPLIALGFGSIVKLWL